MAAGYVLALVLGMVSFENVASAGWFQLPPVGQFGFKIEPSAVIAMVLMCVIEAVEAIDDLTTTASGGLDREPTEQEVSGGIVGNGICSVIGSLLGGIPTATFSQNVGIVILTKIVNRWVIGLSAIFILIAGLIPKIVSVLTKPDPSKGYRRSRGLNTAISHIKSYILRINSNHKRRSVPETGLRFSHIPREHLNPIE